MRNSTNMLFFSRGRGYSHAIRDIQIADALTKFRGDVDLRFVSYGSGAQALAEHHQPLIDLEMPDDNPFWPTATKAGELIDLIRPELVIAHEEFVVPPVAKMFGVPTIFITDWFCEPDDLTMEALSFADEIIFIGEDGIFEEPPEIAGKVFYAGPVLRRFAYGLADRSRARREMDFPEKAVIILVLPGGWATEEREPVWDTVIPAFESLKIPDKLLVWIAGNDFELLTHRAAKYESVIIKERDWQLDRLMVACDVAITKGNRGTVRELSSLGIPSISMSHGNNPIDDTYLNCISTNTALDARTVTRKLLINSILDALRDGVPDQSPGAAAALNSRESGAALAARRIAGRIATIAVK